MKDSQPPKLIIGIAIGAVVGISGLLIAQSLTGGGGDPETGAGEQGQRIESLETQLGAALRRSAELERENKGAIAKLAGTGDGTTPAADPPEVDPEADPEEPNALLKAMMEMGAAGARKKVDAEVAILAERLNLTPAQQEELRAVLLAKLEKQQQAGLLLMSGKATIADLTAADEHNFTEVDAAMADILSESQLEEYAAYAGEREVKRIERKADEELGNLKNVAELSDDQADLAWTAFMEINADEKPGSLPDGTTPDEFNDFIDGAIDKRLERLQPILTEPQLEAYRGQTDSFRQFLSALVKGGAGGGEE